MFALVPYYEHFLVFRIGASRSFFRRAIADVDARQSSAEIGAHACKRLQPGSIFQVMAPALRAGLECLIC